VEVPAKDFIINRGKLVADGTAKPEESGKCSEIVRVKIEKAHR
jgi:hypothetical protein